LDAIVDVVIADEVVKTDYGQVDLLWSPEGGFDGDARRFFANQINGLVGAADPSGVYFHLGRRSGGSAVRIVLRDAAPEVDPAWEDVVEVSTLVPEDADPRWVTWAGEAVGPLDGLKPGIYRLRVSAAGRDAGRADEFAEAIVDTYLLEFWPEPALRPDDNVRVGSADAEYWHREWGANR
jgi:hypothetical protein